MSDRNGLEYVFKKLSKISRVVHYISEKMDKEEPIRLHLRDSVLRSLREVTEGIDKNRATNFRQELMLVCAYLESASSLPGVSVMNCEVLAADVLELADFIDKELVDGSAQKSDQRDLEDWLKVGAGATVETPRLVETKREPAKDKDFVAKPVAKVEKRPATRPAAKSNSFKAGRKDKIMAFLKDNKDSSIKDIAASIDGCSEKTVQRDLVSLVATGAVKREGERRWSRYSLS